MHELLLYDCSVDKHVRHNIDGSAYQHCNCLRIGVAVGVGLTQPRNEFADARPEPLGECLADPDCVALG